MGKTTIHCVRHVQGFRNLDTANYSMAGPRLTPLGREQGAAPAASFPYHKTTHLVAPPLSSNTSHLPLVFPEEVHTRLMVITLPNFYIFYLASQFTKGVEGMVQRVRPKAYHPKYTFARFL